MVLDNLFPFSKQNYNAFIRLIPDLLWSNQSRVNIPQSLPEIRDIDQISLALNFKNGGPRLQRIVWEKSNIINIRKTSLLPLISTEQALF